MARIMQDNFLVCLCTKNREGYTTAQLNRPFKVTATACLSTLFLAPVGFPPVLGPCWQLEHSKYCVYPTSSMEAPVNCVRG
jgi:hypothetical protein